MATNKNIKINLDYSEFSGGIKECQSKMSLLNQQFKLQQTELGNNASKVDKLTLSESTLTQKISLQQQVVSASMDKWYALAHSEEATLQQTEKAHSEYLKQQTILAQLNNELESTREQLDELSTSEQNASETAKDSAQGFESMSDTMLDTISTISAFASAISSVVSTIDDLARSAATSADDIATMATKYGVAQETMEAWVATAGKTDVSAETLGSAMTKLTNKMQDASNGSASASQLFKQLGVHIYDASGNLQSAESVFYQVVDALGEVENQTERDALAMDLMGKSAQDLNPIIQMGSASFKELQQSAQDIIPDGMENDLLNLSDAFDEFDAAMLAGQNTLVGAFAPALTDVLNAISSLDPAILASVVALKTFFSIASSLAPVLQLIATRKIASATATIADTAATGANTAAKATQASAIAATTTAEVTATAATTTMASAEMSATASSAAFTATLSPMVVEILLVADSIALVVIATTELISLIRDMTSESDSAATSLNGLSSAMGGTKGSSSQASSNTKYMASGSGIGGAGGLTWVGEQGAELVNLPYGSTVYNHQESINMVSPSNGNVINVYVDHISELSDLVRIQNQAQQRARMGAK